METDKIIKDYKAGFTISELVNKYTDTRNPSKEVRDQQKVDLINALLLDEDKDECPFC